MTEKTKILYVDDELINLQLFRINMGKKYNVLTAENGLKGLEIMSGNEDIAVVISDMKMPKMNGIEFITTAKKQFPKIDYFILTGYEITQEIQDAIDAGIVLKYFRKPFSAIEIDEAIEEAIGTN
jgi:two-component system, response regulator, stage 0 sporulation protein F